MENEQMDKKCQQLADMISQYRMGELEISINEEHVSRWINQFSENAREVILSETIFVFQKWFFKKARRDGMLIVQTS